MSNLTYPNVRRDEFSEKIHGVEVSDPYRWLENNDDEEVKNFVKEQQKLAITYIQEAPNRAQIKEKLTNLFNYPKYGCPFKRGDYYYMFKNSGLQNQNVMYTFKNLNDEHEIFLDPNTFSEDGSTSLSSTSFSKDGKLMAYSVKKAGSDWLSIFVRDVENRKDLSDELNYCKFTGISWTHDNLGFFYSRYEKDGDVLKETVSNLNHKLYYHRINTAQSEDILIYDTPDHPKYLITGQVSDCGNFLHLSISEKCRDNIWYYAKLDQNLPIKERLNFHPIIENFEFEYDYITNDDNLVYFKTNRDAPNYKVARLDLNNPDPSTWVNIIPENDKDVLDEAICVDQDKLAVIHMKDVINQIEIRYLKDGKFYKKFDIPIGTITSFSGKRVLNEIFFYVTSFLSPGIIYHYDFKTDNGLKVFMEIKLDDFDPNEFETKQVFYETKDAQAKVPMFIVHRKDVELDSTNPCLLYGYGGFSISMQPYFSVNRLLFMKYFKGVYAVACIRGGGEYGSKWYESGRLLNKQKSYDDFIQAGEYLIENRYTCKDKLIIEGGSNGGLLVGVCANQRPDLFAAAVIHVGVLDLLRFDKFTIGHAWVSDYGDRNDEKEGETHFKNQLKLSPLHNVPNDCEKYPATLLLTSDHDNRVVPLHSFKFIAELQYRIRDKQTNPVLLRLDLNAGHGDGKSTEKILNQFVDVYCFLQKALNLKFYV